MIASMKNIVKFYNDEHLALDGLNLEVNEGEVLGLLGPNGSGKTTAIHILCGLIPYDMGEVSLFGQPQDTTNLKIRKYLGLVTQEVTVFKELTARENLQYFGGLYGLRGRELSENIKEVLEFVELTDRANKKPGTFSGGMQRRLNIACSLVHRPKFLIMDEPTVAIDPQSRNHILESVKKIAARGTSILYTSHYMEEVEEISTRVVVMDAGRAIAQGTVDQLIRGIQREEIVRITPFSPTNILTNQLRTVPGVRQIQFINNDYVIGSTPGSENLNRILEVAQHHGGVSNVTADKPNLEDVFLTLTGKKLRDEED